MSAKPDVIDTTWPHRETQVAHRNTDPEWDNFVVRFAERLGPLLLQTDTQEVADSATVCHIPEERRNNLTTLV